MWRSLLAVLTAGLLSTAVWAQTSDDIDQYLKPGHPDTYVVKKGDTVLMPKYGGTEVKIDDKEYQIVREDDILAVIG